MDAKKVAFAHDQADAMIPAVTKEPSRRSAGPKIVGTVIALIALVILLRYLGATYVAAHPHERTEVGVQTLGPEYTPQGKWLSLPDHKVGEPIPWVGATNLESDMKIVGDMRDKGVQFLVRLNHDDRMIFTNPPVLWNHSYTNFLPDAAVNEWAIDATFPHRPGPATEVVRIMPKVR